MRKQPTEKINKHVKGKDRHRRDEYLLLKFKRILIERERLVRNLIHVKRLWNYHCKITSSMTIVPSSIVIIPFNIVLPVTFE